MLLISQHHHKDKNTKTRIKQQNYSFDTMNNDNVKKNVSFPENLELHIYTWLECRYEQNYYIQ